MANIFLTDVRGFANPVIAARLKAAGARVIACDPAIATDGEEEGVEVIAWASPGDLVARAAGRFGGRLDADRDLSGDAGAANQGRGSQHVALDAVLSAPGGEAIAFAGAAVKAMRPNKSGRIVFGSSLRPDRRHTGLCRLCARARP